MSRDGFENNAPILAAATRWKDEALVNDRSVFGVGALWTLDGFKGLERYFVENLDEGEGNFIGKLEGQLSQAPATVKQLASELTWVMLPCPSNTHPPKKRETVEQVWAWSGRALPNTAKEWLTDQVLAGIGSAGPGYNNHRWRELVYAIRFGLAFKALSTGERAKLLADEWKFADWLAKLPEAHVRQFRHMLVYLLFPDSLERIFGGGDSSRSWRVCGRSTRRQDAKLRRKSLRRVSRSFGSTMLEKNFSGTLSAILQRPAAHPIAA